MPLLALLVLIAAPVVPTCVVVDPKAGPKVAFAAREVVRYVYLRTGKVLPIRSRSNGPAIVVKTVSAAGLGAEGFQIRTVSNQIQVVGNDDQGTLYGAYRFAERLGIRFYLHGDTIPDKTFPLSIAPMHEVGKPIFAIRGIVPFHDFPEGPDWWNRDDYLAVLCQMVKLRMNFVGFHSYPESSAGPEPLVWVGRTEDLTVDGLVRRSYPSHWANTRRDGAWGYAATPTSQFSGGAAELFATDDHGPEVMRGMMPRPKTSAESNILFDRTGKMLREVFGEAKRFGVQTCVGAETPMTVPAAVPSKDVFELYKGMTERIRRLYPADWFWLWTPEAWTWGGNTDQQFKDTVKDLHLAVRAMPPNMRFATSGWVLGPQNDRAALDRVLPKNIPMSAISRQVGHAPLDPAFGEIRTRSKWAIPWLENDPAMTAPQLWVGRMRYDAVDAKRYGCDGLLGIHWRTKVIAPNIAALASAAWDQSWAKPLLPPETTGKAQGGETAQFSEPVTGTDKPVIFQSVRYGMKGYSFRLKNGRYKVRLMFNEPYYSEAGKRVFGVRIEGHTVINRLDLYAEHGKNRAYSVDADATVSDGALDIEFTPIIEFPAIAGLVIEGMGTSLSLNAGGPKVDGFQGDENTGGDRTTRSMPTEDFTRDFATANFGVSELGSILSRIDGRNLPEPATWIDGPGGIKIEPIKESDFAFVEEFASHRSRVVGAGNMERFNYWLATFRYLREMARVGAKRFELDEEMKAVANGSSATKALVLRKQLAERWSRMMGYLMETVSTTGDLGTIANLEQHVLRTQRILGNHDEALAKALGSALPESTLPQSNYSGHPRIVVPTVRTTARAGEPLRIRAILMKAKAPTLRWRSLGGTATVTSRFRHFGRGVYEADLVMPKTGVGVEYWITATGPGEQRLRYPSSTRGYGQTVVRF